MRELMEAIEDFWSNNSDLTRYFDGGIHLYKAPNTPDPYVVIASDELFTPKSWDKDVGGFEDRRQFVVIFWVSSTDPTTTSDGVDLVIDTLPHEGFDMNDYKMLHFYLDRKQRVETVDNRYTNMLEYECIIEEV